MTFIHLKVFIVIVIIDVVAAGLKYKNVINLISESGLNNLISRYNHSLLV